MSVTKIVRDRINKILSWNKTPQEVKELKKYLYNYGPINFKKEKQEDGTIIAISQNFNLGSIITDGRNEKELEENIKDAILTAFKVPSVYLDETGLYKIGSEQNQYATVK